MSFYLFSPMSGEQLEGCFASNRKALRLPPSRSSPPSGAQIRKSLSFFLISLPPPSRAPTRRADLVRSLLFSPSSSDRQREYLPWLSPHFHASATSPPRMSTAFDFFQKAQTCPCPLFRRLRIWSGDLLLLPPQVSVSGSLPFSV